MPAEVVSESAIQRLVNPSGSPDPRARAPLRHRHRFCTLVQVLERLSRAGGLGRLRRGSSYVHLRNKLARIALRICRQFLRHRGFLRRITQSSARHNAVQWYASFDPDFHSTAVTLSGLLNIMLHAMHLASGEQEACSHRAGQASPASLSVA